jgi:hypothetical protein
MKNILFDVKRPEGVDVISVKKHRLIGGFQHVMKDFRSVMQKGKPAKPLT